MPSKTHAQFTAHGPFRIKSYDEDNAYHITFCHINDQPGDTAITLFLNDKATFDAMLEAFDTTRATNFRNT